MPLVLLVNALIIYVLIFSSPRLAAQLGHQFKNREINRQR